MTSSADELQTRLVRSGGSADAHARISGITSSRRELRLTGMLSVQKQWFRIMDKLFMLRCIVQTRLRPQRPIRILFSSDTGWDNSIRRGFRFTPHTITFSPFTAQNIQEHDLVVPLTIADLKFLITSRGGLESNALPIPSEESLQLCDDKFSFNQRLAREGFAAYIPPMDQTSQFPYILKKRINAFGQDCYIIRNASQELAVSKLLQDPDYFSQRIVTGQREYATHILFKDQRIVSALNIEYVFASEMPIKGQEQPLYTRVCPSPHLELFSAILSAINFQGLCCFNYKNSQGHPYILEINPRCGGSLCPFLFAFIASLET